MALPLRRLSLTLALTALIGCGDSHPPEEEYPAREFPAQDYCDCMFLSCHDIYHDTWGHDEIGARAECVREAEAVPVVGEPVTAGDAIECRLFYCENEPLRDCSSAGVANNVCRE